MASGNGPARVTILLRVPRELDEILKVYQNNRRLVSKTIAIIELLESHPELLDIVRTVLYDGSQKGNAKITGE